MFQFYPKNFVFRRVLIAYITVGFLSFINALKMNRFDNFEKTHHYCNLSLKDFEKSNF